MKMERFYYYLKMQNMKESTTQEHIKNVERFMKWAEQTGGVVSKNNSAGTEQITYPELLEYVQCLKQKKLEISTINIRLGSIRKYYDHLKEEGVIEKNPAKRLHIKGAIKKIINNPLNYSELENLYQQYAHYLDHKPQREKKQQHTRLRSKII